MSRACCTLGLTGIPKGVLTPHRSVVNHSSWIARAYGVGHAERVLQASPFSFDASMWELTMPLITGGAVVMGRHSDESIAGVSRVNHRTRHHLAAARAGSNSISSRSS